MKNDDKFVPVDSIVGNEDKKMFVKLTPHLFDCCLEYIKMRKCSEKTNLLYTSELKNIFKNPILTQTIYNKIYSKGNYYRSVLKLITESCEHFDIKNYKYKIIKQIKKKRKKPQVWPEKDIIKMISNIEEYSLLMECSYYIGAGIRFSSALFLSWDNLLWEDWLEDTNKTGKCDIHGKGDKDKVLFVDQILMNKLYNIAKNRNKLFKGIPYKNSSEDLYLFIKNTEIEQLEDNYKKQNFDNILDSNKEQINVKDRAKLEMIRKKHYLVDYKLKKLSKLLNVNKIKFQSTRHSRATNLLKKGFKLLTIKEQLMHESITTTEIYLTLENIEVENEFNEKL